MLLKDCNVSKASNISSLHRETQSFNTECNRVKIIEKVNIEWLSWARLGKKKRVPYFGELNKVIHRNMVKGFVIFLFLYNNKPGSKRGCASQ